ncbi:DUF1422 family protein [Thaumasiovibrio subtropicus]|uniref:DUF1422 family protein n=1 Tax=Thaumasiovibrio subtropicus TaxID=1891207 RepID=UPI000B36295C|nr:DUF1422 family protein [Thaumasiovibrio subtropicus]
MEKASVKRSILLFAFIGGVAGNASVAALTNSLVPFSIFPLLTFGFAMYSIYQTYVAAPYAEGTLTLSTGTFLVGAFGYSAFLRALNPELGSNFFSLILMLGILFWIAIKVGVMSPSSSKSNSTA